RPLGFAAPEARAAARLHAAAFAHRTRVAFGRGRRRGAFRARLLGAALSRSAERAHDPQRAAVFEPYRRRARAFGLATRERLGRADALAVRVVDRERHAQPLRP